MEQVAAETLRKGDVTVVSAGEIIPGDGTVIEDWLRRRRFIADELGVSVA